MKNTQQATLPKTLVIGLDMGDGDLIRRWAEAGYLKTFNALMERGAWANLDTPADTLHVSAWPSLYTGTLPGDHGVYYTYQALKGRQNARQISAGQYGKPPVWKILGDSGVPCIVMDAPYTFPEKMENSIQIFEWGTWAWYWTPMSVPDEIWGKLKVECGSYPLGYEANKIGLGALPIRKLRDRLIKSAEKKGEAAAWLLNHHTWEFAWIVFGETHPAGHYLCFSNHDASRATEYCKTVYQSIDRAIGTILRCAEGPTHVFIISGDGVGSNNAGWHLLPEVMKKKGYLVEPSDSVAEESKSNIGAKKKKDFLKQIRGLLPVNFRQMVSRRLPAVLRGKLTARWAQSSYDWSRTRAYCLPTDLEGCIRINLKGREPEGIVDPGDDYQNLCEEIVDFLYGLRDEETQKRIVKSVSKIKECFAGEKLDDLPDIVVHWDSECKIRSIHHPQHGIRATGDTPDNRTGTHIPPGFVISSCNNTSECYIPEAGNVIDLVPTLLSLMKVPNPKYMKGRVWPKRSSKQN